MCEMDEPPNPLMRYVRALHCPTRWHIIRFIGGGERSTGEIRDFLEEDRGGPTGSGLYFHLSELRKAGIVEVSGYREEGGGAPEKVWRLRTRRIEIDLLDEGGEAL